MDKPLDCIGTSGPIGKHDFRPHADGTAHIHHRQLPDIAGQLKISMPINEQDDEPHWLFAEHFNADGSTK
jgi:hypothetical protein